mmetsp:Transcript_20578/g.45865  ORF Transcript_20578/g.45865 Transcript_20578/m.45865 type:complete len:215 (-) Transcript_20578:4445-5089(-)
MRRDDPARYVEVSDVVLAVPSRLRLLPSLSFASEEADAGAAAAAGADDGGGPRPLAQTFLGRSARSVSLVRNSRLARSSGAPPHLSPMRESSALRASASTASQSSCGVEYGTRSIPAAAAGGGGGCDAPSALDVVLPSEDDDCSACSSPAAAAVAAAAAVTAGAAANILSASLSSQPYDPPVLRHVVSNSSRAGRTTSFSTLRRGTVRLMNPKR